MCQDVPSISISIDNLSQAYIVYTWYLAKVAHATEAQGFVDATVIQQVFLV